MCICNTGLEPEAVVKGTWVALLDKKVIAAVAKHRKRLVARVFNDYDCDLLRANDTLLHTRIAHHWHDTKASVEDGLRTYKEESFWPAVETSIVSELNAMFKLFCAKQTANNGECGYFYSTLQTCIC